jgi:exopolyphosphatase/guanosine-5'-triphosphate,3'-diphosphate pyrophosphatase
VSITAVIDVGTNSVKVLVADGGRDLLRALETTRLGEGLAGSGVLSPAAMERTAAAVSGFAARARELGAGTVTVVGTAACRRAQNTAELATRIEQECGLGLTVLTGEQEASLSFTGALRRLPRIAGNTLVVDIGGGSTELTVGVDEPHRAASIPVGAVTATESDLTTDPPRPEDLTNVIGAVQDELEELGRLHPEMLTASRVVGIAGTIVTVAAVEIGQAVFDEEALHGFVLTREAAEDVFRTLATESLADRVRNPGLPRERADIIVAGCCILVGVMRRLQLQEITVSTGSLRDGVIERGRLGP